MIRSRMATPRNIFAPPETPVPASREIFESLVECHGVKVERIISHSAASPEGVWYDQEHDEWVLLLKGEAVLHLHPDTLISLKTGDHLFLPAHQKHRVASTAAETLWLAVHITPSKS